MATALRRRLAVLLCAAGLLAAVPSAAQQAAPAPPSDPDAYLHAPPRPASVRGRFSLVSVGDVMLARPPSPATDPAYEAALALVRSGDAAIGNQEGVAVDLRVLKSGARGQGGLVADPAVTTAYKPLGLDLLSVANNHSTDFGDDALVSGMALLDRAGIAHAGGGRTLAQAREAGTFVAPNARVALVATASTFKPGASATDAAGPITPRAGISTLRLRAVHLVTPAQFALLRSAATTLASPLEPAPPAGARQFTFGDRIYRLSDRTGRHYDMDLFDHAALLKAVHDAKAANDLVVFHIHAHESPTGLDDDTPQPPDFLVRLFHDAVNAGADVAMGGGPHSLRGIEIYKGKPLFYGLGLFFFKPMLMGVPGSGFARFPEDGYPDDPDPRPNTPDLWYDSVLAITDFDGPKVLQVRLYPIDLARGGTTSARGLPHLATGARARGILEQLRRDSSPLGTRIDIRGDMGVIRVD